MKCQLTGPACLFLLTALQLVASESARGRLEDFTSPILQTAAGERTGPAILSSPTGSRPAPEMSLALATPAASTLGTELSSGGGSLIYTGSPITEKQMASIRAEWKAQDAKRLERIHRENTPWLHTMDRVFPEPQMYRVGHTEMGGGIVNAVEQRNVFCLLDPFFFLWSF